MNSQITLSQLSIGEKASIVKLISSGENKRRMLDLGLVNDTIIEALYVSPSKDPKAYYFKGCVFALRSEDANQIIVKPLCLGV